MRRFSGLIILRPRLQILQLGLLQLLHETRQERIALLLAQQFFQHLVQVGRLRVAVGADAAHAGVVEADQIEAVAKQPVAAVLHRHLLRIAPGYRKLAVAVADRRAAIRQHIFVQQRLQQLSDHTLFHQLITLRIHVRQPVAGDVLKYDGG